MTQSERENRKMHQGGRKVKEAAGGEALDEKTWCLGMKMRMMMRRRGRKKTRQRTRRRGGGFKVEKETKSTSHFMFFFLNSLFLPKQ